jgi:hypothetical protein
MTPEHWKQVKEIFNAALARSVDERAAFLDEACGADLLLRQQVERLINSHEQAGDFIFMPLLNRVPGATGTRFSRSAQPKPSAHTMSAPTPTATESPGRFCSVRLARTLCRPRSTASAHFRAGSASITDCTFCGSGCKRFAVRVIYAWIPSIATSSPPTATTSATSKISSGFRLFDLFPPARLQLQFLPLSARSAA